jgi:deoxyadenosine/deoxycytidine kinase
MYIIEGNIGAGKTTFLNIIKTYMPHIKIVDEPLASWDNKAHGQSLLEYFYKDTPRWAFTMEMYTLMCRVKEHMREQQIKNNYIVMERSIYSGYYCFALNSYQQKCMTELEWEVHCRWFDYLVSDKCLHPNGFIYLRTSPERAYERTKKRNRLGEETIPLVYLQQIHDRLESFLINKENLLPGLEKVPVLILDCDQEFATQTSKRNQLLDAVTDFLTLTQPCLATQHSVPLENTNNAVAECTKKSAPENHSKTL